MRLPSDLGPSRAAATRRPGSGRPRRPRATRLPRTLLALALLAALVTAGSPGWGLYRIRSGDTLGAIAARYGTSVERLVQVNRLPGNGNLIFAGETLKVPVAGRAPATRTVTVKRKHRVVAGDSLIKIARTYGVRPEVIARANDLPSSLVVRLGDTLVVPVTKRVARTSRSSSNTFAGRTYASSVVNAAARNRAVLASRRVPSRDAIRAMIVRTAKHHGVDPNLALAVSWQESGFNMRAVSVANAIGAMQVIPSTGEWISGVVGRRLDLLKARDNVTAGVVLLRILTRSASERKAIAGYYQGLRSVRERGMYPDTKRYVANILALKRQFAGR